MQEKKNFYINNYEDESMVKIEEKRLNVLLKSKKVRKANMEIDGIYYSLDNHNLFKRIDRYNWKYFYFPVVLFGLMTLFNFSEIILNIVFFITRIQSEDYDNWTRIVTLMSNMIYISLVQIMASFTIPKFEVRTIIYY